MLPERDAEPLLGATAKSIEPYWPVIGVLSSGTTQLTEELAVHEQEAAFAATLTFSAISVVPSFSRPSEKSGDGVMENVHAEAIVKGATLATFGWLPGPGSGLVTEMLGVPAVVNSDAGTTTSMAAQ
jgi:hypothetical protein